VSLVHSVFSVYGSRASVGEFGFVLHNRGAAFSLDPRSPNVVAPRKRPFHTIIPGFMEKGDLHIGFGIMGGLNQAQAHAQFVSTGGTRFYARGDYYAGMYDLWSFDAGNELFDDGLHGDGAGNDGVYGAWVTSDQPPGRHEFKIANADYTLNWPHDPANPTVNARLWTTVAGEVVHFRLDTNVVGDGWQPAQYAVATDHFAPPGTVFEVMGSDPETGNWFGTPLAAVQQGALWRAVTRIAAVGDHEFKFRAAGLWDLCDFGRDYNLLTGLNFSFTTSQPGTEIAFELDTATGRGRAVQAGLIAVQSTTWGALKSRFR
jgi:hypothetical protein